MNNSEPSQILLKQRDMSTQPTEDKKNSKRDYVFRVPDISKNDGAGMQVVAADGKVLEVNTLYCYNAFVLHFGDDGCIVAQRSDTTGDTAPVCGYIQGYRPPTHRNAVFVWQVGVHPTEQRQGRERWGMCVNIFVEITLVRYMLPNFFFFFFFFPPPPPPPTNSFSLFYPASARQYSPPYGNKRGFCGNGSTPS